MEQNKQREDSALRIRTLREKLGMTAQETAVRFSVPLNTWRSWESGKRMPPSYVVDLLETVTLFLAGEECRQTSMAVMDRITYLEGMRSLCYSEEERRQLCKAIDALQVVSFALSDGKE